MSSFLTETQNLGILVHGRVLEGGFASTEAIANAAAAVSEVAEAFGVPLSFVYAGTTINWPEGFEHTACLVGVVTHVDQEPSDPEHDEDEDDDDDDAPRPLPRTALIAPTISDDVWSALEARGLALSSDGLYLTVAGWTWTEISNADGEPLASVSAEDYRAFQRLDESSPIVMGDEALFIRTSYC